ncbi:hypothetical protein [Peribacillus acanthi]|uniref:hypothetical protein n=1 Tax=Peribacillus acanthi TaxID=2171554 RepID=UPI000D3E8931|nr:hypothetical protein [Peribacillus acanthi]
MRIRILIIVAMIVISLGEVLFMGVSSRQYAFLTHWDLLAPILLIVIYIAFSGISDLDQPKTSTWKNSISFILLLFVLMLYIFSLPQYSYLKAVIYIQEKENVDVVDGKTPKTIKTEEGKRYLIEIKDSKMIVVFNSKTGSYYKVVRE